MRKTYLGWNDITEMVFDLHQKMSEREFRPDLIVGLSRGGLTPAVMLSHRFKVPLLPLRFSTRDYEASDDLDEFNSRISVYHDVLVVDDINDTGYTFMKLYNSKYISKRFYTAALVQRSTSRFRVDYFGMLDETEDWISFPWEY